MPGTLGILLLALEVLLCELLETPLSEDRNLHFILTGYTIVATVQQTLALDLRLSSFGNQIRNINKREFL